MSKNNHWVVSNLSMTFATVLAFAGVSCASARPDESSNSAASLQAFTELVDAGDGVTVKFEYRPELKGGVMAVQGPSTQKAKLDRLSNVKSLPELYRMASGKAEVPARISALAGLVSSASLAEADTKPYAANPPAGELPVVDDAAGVQKGVAEWESTWCNHDKVDNTLTTNAWFQKTDWCYPWAGGNAVYYKNSVRQAMAFLEVFYGSINLQLRTKMSDSSTWGAYGTWTVTQGNNIILRTWSNYSTPIDVNFNTTDFQDGEVYGIAIQLADTPTTEMLSNAIPKLVGGRDYYMVKYTCVATNGYGYNESCQDNSMYENTNGALDYFAMNTATNLCASYGGALWATVQRMTVNGSLYGQNCGLYAKNCMVQTNGLLDCNCLGTCNYGYGY